MKKIFFVVTFFILVLSMTFVGWGVYLNKMNNSYIETMLASRAVSLSGAEISYRDVYPELYLTYINLRTKMQADAIAEIDGLIDELYVSQGDEVKEGQPLCKIVNKDVPLALSKADTDIAKAEASYLQMMSTVERNKRLASADAVPASELEMSVSQMKAAKAELDAARIAKKQMKQGADSQIITAPLSGTVIVSYKKTGNLITKGSPVLMLADFSKMYFTVLVDDKKVRNILPADGKFSLLTDLSNMTEKAFDSAAKSSFSADTAFGVEISSIAPSMDEDVPVRSLTFQVDNSLGIMELGMYTDIVIRKDAPKRVLAIPRGAIVYTGDTQSIIPLSMPNMTPDEGAPRVYLRGDDSRLELRPIKTGIYDAVYTEVLEGLQEGDIVITSGVENLDLGVRIDVDIFKEDIQ